MHFHFTPTSASWMNMVEIWFSILTKQQVRRGVYHDVPELIAAIEHFIEGYNERAVPFVWTKTPDQVLAKAIKRKTLQTRCTSEPLMWRLRASVYALHGDSRLPRIPVASRP